MVRPHDTHRIHAAVRIHLHVRHTGTDLELCRCIGLCDVGKQRPAGVIATDPPGRPGSLRARSVVGGGGGVVENGLYGIAQTSSR